VGEGGREGGYTWQTVCVMRGCQTGSIFVFGFDRLFEQTFAIISKYAAVFGSARDSLNRIGVSRAIAITMDHSADHRADRALSPLSRVRGGEGGVGNTSRAYPFLLSFFFLWRVDTLSDVDRLSRADAARREAKGRSQAGAADSVDRRRHRLTQPSTPPRCRRCRRFSSPSRCHVIL